MAERFRAGVGAVVCDRAGRVLLLERRDHPGSWQFPQGGIEDGEDPEAALWRELGEETGLGPTELEIVHVVPEWLGYELPPEQRRPKTGRGQVQKWFVLRTAADTTAPRLHDGMPEFRDWRWAHLDDAVERVVPFRRAVYERLRSVIAALPG
jgi:putative (di)nucleoside polyphosphate hydrolase